MIVFCHSDHFVWFERCSQVFSGSQLWFQDVLAVAECMQDIKTLSQDIQLKVCFAVGFDNDLTEFLRVNNFLFTRKADNELVEVVNRIYVKRGDRKAVRAFELKISAQDMVQYPEMQALQIDSKARMYRFHVLSALNQRVRTLLPLVNLSVPRGKSTLTDGIRAIRSIMFWSTKEALWSRALRSTAVNKKTSRDEQPTVNIDKMRALKFKNKNSTSKDGNSNTNVDRYGKETIFGQVMSILHMRDVTMFRVTPNQRAFKVVEVGFNSQVGHFFFFF